MKDTGHKWGLPLDSLKGPELNYVPEKFAEKPSDTFSLIEKFRPFKQEIEEYAYWTEDPDKLRQASHFFQVDPIFNNFTFDELAKYSFSEAVQTSVGDIFQRYDYDRWDKSDTHEYFEVVPPEPAEFVYKLKNSMWHFGKYPSNWNHLVTAYYAIPDYSFGPDFEIRFDHSRYFNFWGRAQHTEDEIMQLTKRMSYEKGNEYYKDNTLYLDGIFAYLVYYKGHHVMTLSFGVGAKTILICQVQLREKKGNRWLYRLPTNYLDYVVESFYHHFTKKWGMKLYLVTGFSLATRLARLHDADDPLPSEAAERITLFYDKPLAKFKRLSTSSLKRCDLEFTQIIPKKAELRRNPESDLRQVEDQFQIEPTLENLGKVNQLRYRYQLPLITGPLYTRLLDKELTEFLTPNRLIKLPETHPHYIPDEGHPVYLYRFQRQSILNLIPANELSSEIRDYAESGEELFKVSIILYNSRELRIHLEPYIQYDRTAVFVDFDPRKRNNNWAFGDPYRFDDDPHHLEGKFTHYNPPTWQRQGANPKVNFTSAWLYDPKLFLEHLVKEFILFRGEINGRTP